MSLSLTQASTNKVTVTNPQTLGSGSAFSYAQWIKPRGTPNNSEGTNKGGVDLFVWSTTDTGRYFQYVGRATTAAESSVRTANLFPANNVWYFVVTTYSESSGVRFYRGDRTTAPVEMTYSAQTVGSGATTSDSGNLYIGNRGSGNSLAPPHDLYAVGWWNNELTLGQIQELWMNVRSTVGCQMLLLLGDNGTSTQPDYSGNGNSGTVTGATQSDNPPLARRWRRAVIEVPYQVTSGDNSANLTGQAITLAQGTLATRGDVSTSLSGQGITLATGTISVRGDVSSSLTGQAVTLIQGSATVRGDVAPSLTGQTITLSQGTLSVRGDVSLGLTGQSITFGQGTISVSAGGNVSVSLSGQSITLQLGGVTVQGDLALSLTGQSITLAQGSPTASGTANVFLSGQVIALSQGFLTIPSQSGTHFYVTDRSGARYEIVSNGVVRYTITSRSGQRYGVTWRD